MKKSKNGERKWWWKCKSENKNNAKWPACEKSVIKKTKRSFVRYARAWLLQRDLLLAHQTLLRRHCTGVVNCSTATTVSLNISHSVSTRSKCSDIENTIPSERWLNLPMLAYQGIIRNAYVNTSPKIENLAQLLPIIIISYEIVIPKSILSNF